MSLTLANHNASRLLGVDALRGVAAAMVLVFHYSTRFGQLHGPTPGLGFEFDGGRLGVQLFFMISGFVIFMTLDRTKHPSEFVVSRFSRLYPVFWVAVLLTGIAELATHTLGERYGFKTVALNLLMVHGLFQVPDIDGAYWTLQVELLFYLSMLTVWLFFGFSHFRLLLAGWLALAFVKLALTPWLGVSFPNVLTEFLVLDYIPWFAMGMVLYLSRNKNRHRADVALFALAIGCVACGTSVELTLVTLGFATLLAVAVIRPPAILLARPIVWLGAISYPLYLVHENLGYTFMLISARWGWTPWQSACVATACALLLAWALHVLVERPAMFAIRKWHRRSVPLNSDRVFSEFDRRVWMLGVAVAACLLLIGNRISLMR